MIYGQVRYGMAGKVRFDSLGLGEVSYGRLRQVWFGLARSGMSGWAKLGLATVW